MLKILSFFSMILIGSLTIQAQDSLYVGWYNLENAFDTIDNPNMPGGNGDDEYIPESESKWTADRYDLKLRNLASVINKMNNGQGPDILGVCEVENQYVLIDLINKYLNNKNYRIVYKESQDVRSIDVALIYRSDKIDWDMMSAYSITLPDGYLTRDVISVKFLKNRKPLYVLMNHWPSKRGGSEKSEPNRIIAAERTKDAVADIYLKDKNADIMLLGDFNDNPDEPALAKTLGAVSIAEVGKIKSDYWNLVIPIWNPEKTGSYNYNSKWDMIDNIIVTNGMLDNSGFSVIPKTMEIISSPEMIEQTGKYAGSPFRTYAGKKFLGGFSDHFPIGVRILLNN